jgi:hypothetical protein
MIQSNCARLPLGLFQELQVKSVSESSTAAAMHNFGPQLKALAIEGIGMALPDAMSL